MASPDFAYAGLVDLDPINVQTFARDHGIPEKLQYTDYRKAFRELDADAALIVAASPAHYEICKEALENGLHVLVEKPFTLSLSEAEELVRLAQTNNKIIMVNQNYRFFSSVLTLKRAMRDESPGKPRFIHGQFFCHHDGKPYQREMEDYILLEMSVHHIDMIRFLLDSDIVGVRGKSWNEPGSGYKGDPHISAVYETEAGIPVFYISSLLAVGVPMPWEGVWRLQYEHAALYLDDLGEGFGVYRVGADQVKRKLPQVVPERESIHGSLAEFARSIREQREPIASGRDNLRTLDALFATSRSAKEGKEIRIPKR
jgi:predicted dehydrogenase